MFNHSCFCFIDVKHLVNKDSAPKKLRCCPLSPLSPLTDRMDFIVASGDFREAYNLIACISGNPLKKKPCIYTIGKQNGTAVAFINFCEMMVVSGWLCHDEVIIMDNVAIHTGGDLAELEQFLWDETVWVDDR
jgi:hypothetical protein